MNLQIISFNIRNCSDVNGHSVPERAERLQKIVMPLDADIICFQEYSNWWEPHIDEIFTEKYEMFNKFRAENDFESTPILWKKDKFNSLKKGYFWFSDTPEVESRGWDEKYNCFRICLWTVLEEKSSGERVTVFNTHFGFGDGGQVASAKLLDKYVKKVSAHPTFVTGDFNMTTDSLGYKEMCKNFTDVNAATVNDLRDTYHGYDPSVKRDTHIDFCFISSDINPISQRIIDETVDGKFPSDHFGLLMNLEI